MSEHATAHTESDAHAPEHAMVDAPARLPAAVRWFSWALFLRNPLVVEVPEIESVLAWARRHWWKLALAETGFIGLVTVPALLREGSWLYHLAAVVVPQFLVYVALMSVAYAWVGYRVNLRTMGSYVPEMRRKRSKATRIGVVIFMLLSGMVTGFMVARGIMGSSGSLMDWATSELSSYWSDTFRTGLLFGMLLLGLLVGVPELIARMRVREDKLQSRVLRAEAEAQRLARHQAESELRLLQAQVQPHFLYNTLANVRYLIQKNSPDALRMTDALIEYLRTAVTDIRADRVTLGQEVDHVRHYLTIMEMRMQGRLRFVIDVPEPCRARTIPPLVLLTLVENAVKHGVARAVEGGEIVLRACDTGHDVDAACRDLVVEVSDTGPGVSAADASPLPAGTGTGLNNARERLRLLAGERATLELLPRAPDVPGGGMTARIILPGTPVQAESEP